MCELSKKIAKQDALDQFVYYKFHLEDCDGIRTITFCVSGRHPSLIYVFAALRIRLLEAYTIISPDFSFYLLVDFPFVQAVCY